MRAAAGGTPWLYNLRMRYLLSIAFMLVLACVQTSQDARVTTETTAAAVSGQDATPRSEVTIDATAGAEANPSCAQPPCASSAIEPNKSAPRDCKTMACPKGTRCELIDVQCMQMPCPPVPECKPDAEPAR